MMNPIAIPITWALVGCQSGLKNDDRTAIEDPLAKAKLASDVIVVSNENQPSMYDNGRERCRGASAAVHQ